MNKMSLFKRSIAILLAIAMVTALGGCGNGTSTANTQTASKTESESIARESKAETKQEEIEEALEGPQNVMQYAKTLELSQAAFFEWDIDTVKGKVIESEEYYVSDNAQLAAYLPNENMEFSVSDTKDVISQIDSGLNGQLILLSLNEFSGKSEISLSFNDGTSIQLFLINGEVEEVSEDYFVISGMTYADLKATDEFMSIWNKGLIEEYPFFTIWNEELGIACIAYVGDTITFKEGDVIITSDSSTWLLTDKDKSEFIVDISSYDGASFDRVITLSKIEEEVELVLTFMDVMEQEDDIQLSIILVPEE